MEDNFNNSSKHMSNRILLRKRLLSIPLEYWWGALFILLCLTFLFSVLSLIVTRWIEQGNSNGYWYGGLLQCTGCSGKWEGETYNSIYSDFCGESEIDGICHTIEMLNIAGIAYSILELLLLVCIIFVCIKALFEFISFNSIFLSKYSTAVFLFGFCCHLAACSLWFAVTQAGYANCDKISGMKEESLCASFGPNIGIIVAGLLLIDLFLYFLIQYKSKKKLVYMN